MSSLPLSVSGTLPAEIVVKAATEAGKVLKKHFYQLKEIHLKSRGNIFTAADIASQNLIVDILQKEFPDSGIIGEESVDIASRNGYTWIIDPLDGSNNFAFGVPFFCINIALVYGDEIIMGSSYDPLRDELFIAEKGKGCRLNGSPVHVTSHASLKTAFLGCDLGYNNERGKEIIQVALSLWPEMHGMRLLGSAALGLAYVACGRLHLYFHRYLYPWDIASGILLVREAGGSIVNWEGQPANMKSMTVIASNNTLVEQFLNKMKQLGFSNT